MTPILHLQSTGERIALLPCGHVIQELQNGGCIVVIAGYGTAECRETFREALAQFEGIGR